MRKILQTPSESIQRLLQHGRFLNYITQRIKTYLPADFSDKITVVRFNKKILVIAVNSSGWASKLRFYLPELKRSLSIEDRFAQLDVIKIRVSAQKKLNFAASQTPIHSNFAAKTVQENAQCIKNEQLKASLLNLSRHIAEKPAAKSDN